MSAARERIIGAALTLVGDQGMSAVTMVAVAEAAGVARATLYNHYPDVASILADAVASHNEHAIDSLQRAIGVVSTPAQTIEQVVRQIASMSGAGHSMTSYHHFPPEFHDELGAFDRAVEDILADSLQRGVDQGVFRQGLDISITSRVLRQALVGVSDAVAAEPERTGEIVESVVETLLSSVGSHSP